MSYATLLAYIDAEDTTEQRVRLAASLADKFNATLIGFSAIAIKASFVAEGVVIEEVTEIEITEMKARRAAKGDWFRNMAGAEHRKVEWRSTLDFPLVQDALPLLHEAARVSIVEICRSGEEETAQQHIADVAHYLERHRINAGREVIIRQQGSGAAQLIRLAQDEGADLLVTGAYGHSRLGEWIFGGITRDLLASSPFCCLMAH